jgi:hypothetical protein
VLGDGRRAVAVNVGAGGMYIVLPGSEGTDSWASFELAVPSAGISFRAVAEVLRTERLDDGRTGVALRLHQPQLVALT